MDERELTISEVAPEALLGPLNQVEKKNAPARLYVAGDVRLLDAGPRVAVVGTRKPTDLGKSRTEQLVLALVGRGIVVVSGLAKGVDTIAHRIAIESGGKTIAILGTGIDQFSPKENRELQLTIVEKHLAVSEFPPGSPGGRKNFPMRNRTMALFSDATIIVEAGESSGTRHQGWEALRLGRLVFLLQNIVENQDLVWPKEMLAYGAQVLSRENLDIVLDDMPQRPRGELAF